jgi:hypothetical protein
VLSKGDSIASCGFLLADSFCNDLLRADIQREIPFLTVKIGSLLFAKIHGYLLGLKSIKTMIMGFQKI